MSRTLVTLCHALAGLLAGATMGTAQQRPASPLVLTARSVVDTALPPSDAHDYILRLPGGTSALVSVQQMGIDVVVEVRDQNGRLIDAVDSPTGRTGDERVEVVAEKGGGHFALRVRPFAADEPAGRYRLNVAEWRDARATMRLLAHRARVRDSAIAWLRERSAELRLERLEDVRPLASAVEGARVVGLGEATHGSRELGDLRLAVTQHLVRRHGFRMIAVEHSADNLAILNTWALGGSEYGPDVRRALDAHWIGRRTLEALTQWLRAWNAEHPGDPVTLVGVDAHDHARARERVRAVLARGWGAAFVARFDTASAELAQADSLAAVFANSSVGAATQRTIMEVVARLDADTPLLARTLGDSTLAAAREAARTLMQFADFNARTGSGRSRDWYMAVNLLRALERAPAGTRAVYWAHNAHVAVSPSRSPRFRTTGGLLREAFGCGYRAWGTGFGAGGFVAQRTGDPSNRLEASTLPQAPEETIDGVMGGLLGTPAMAAWTCGVDLAHVPGWLRVPRPMHWIGGVFDPSAPATSAFQPFRVLQDFDALLYLPVVSADDVVDDWPPIQR